jgi:hypothetical protein
MRRILFAAPFFCGDACSTGFVGGCHLMRKTCPSGELRQILATGIA